MRTKLLGLLTATLLVSACASKQEEVATTDTTGGTQTAAPTTQVDNRSLNQRLAEEVGDRVFFGFDRYDLTPEAQATLQKQAAFLAQYPAARITIEGHADERGTREYNLALGERRANAVKNYLVALGVPAGRVETISYGKERPEVLGSGEEVWARNRRAVTVVQ